MSRGSANYLSYLLRLWRVQKKGAPDWGGPVWRASLQSPQTGERVSFATLEDLFAFLRAQMGLRPDVEDVGARECVDQDAQPGTPGEQFTD